MDAYTVRSYLASSKQYIPKIIIIAPNSHNRQITQAYFGIKIKRHISSKRYPPQLLLTRFP